MMKNVLVAFLLIIFFISCHTEENKDSNKSGTNQKFDNYASNFVNELWKIFPDRATNEGLHDYDSCLVIPGVAHREAVLKFVGDQKDSLRQFDIITLTNNRKIDYYLIRDFIEKEQFSINELKEYQWNPSQYNLAGDFFNIINYKGFSLDKRLRNISQKLNNIAAYYKAAREDIDNPTLVHTNLAISQLDGSKIFFSQTIRDSLKASTLSGKDRAIINKKLLLCVKEISLFTNWLRDTIKPQIENGQIGRDFRLGEKLYNKKFNYYLESGFGAREIYKKAIERKNLLHKKMYAITEKLWSKYLPTVMKPNWKEDAIKMLLDTLSTIHPKRDSFIQTIREQIPKLADFVRKKDLLTLDSTKPLVVRETPKYMRGVAGASISAPGYYDANSETFYQLTPLDGYSKKQAESYLREYNQYTLQILNMHEAIPGHFVQLVYSNKSSDIIKSIFSNGAMVEGWAVYSELMMMENGYGNNSDEFWLMYYKWNLRTVCNTILDYSVHVLGVNEEEAMNLLIKEAFQQEKEAKGKWKRVQLTSVQLCSYFTGFYEIESLKNDIKNKKGSQFNLKKFNEEFLSHGSVPVKYIRMLMMGTNK